MQNSETSDGGGWRSEDVWAIWLGWLVLAVALAATWIATPKDIDARLERYASRAAEEDALREAGASEQEIEPVEAERDELRDTLATNPLAAYLGKVGSWRDNPLRAVVDEDGGARLVGIAGVLVVSLVLFGLGLLGMGERLAGFPLAFAGLFLLSLLAYVLAEQVVVKHYNLEYALWALVVGLLISNTIGTPAWLQPAVRTEFYIKTGLVLLGAEVLFNRLLALGVPGVFVAWVVTPIVLITTYIFGQTGAEDSIAVAQHGDLGRHVGVRRIGRDRHGGGLQGEEGRAVAGDRHVADFHRDHDGGDAGGDQSGGHGRGAGRGVDWRHDRLDRRRGRGRRLSSASEALAVAATVKMIQNILIGVMAFGVAVYWVTCVERDRVGAPARVWAKIWRRFPKFVLGFLAASIAVLGTRGRRRRAERHGVGGDRRHVEDVARLVLLPGVREHRPGNATSASSVSTCGAASR